MSLILMHDKVTLRPMVESDIVRLWKLTTPETFMFMVNQIQTVEEFEKWMRQDMNRCNLPERPLYLWLRIQRRMNYMVQHACMRLIM